MNHATPPPLPRSGSEPKSPPAASAANPIGMVLGGTYRIDAKLGEGGMGAVYIATQLTVDRKVAIKVLRPQFTGTQRAQLSERFRREARATSRLAHPNTVRVFDFGETDDGMLYLVLELLHGASLSAIIARDAPMAPARVAAIGKQIAKSLSEAHAAGIIHRDLKPDNIFICNFHGDPDFPKVMDFGIARVLTGDDAADMTRTGMMIGTPKYIAPEQAMARKVTPAADLYSLGVILYEMLTGSPPFQAESAMALALAHINDPMPALMIPNVSAALGAQWQDLIGRLLAKMVKRRPGQAGEVAVWLGDLERGARAEERGGGTMQAVAVRQEHHLLGSAGVPPVDTVTVARERAAASNSIWIALAAGVFMALGGVVAYGLVSDEDGAQTQRGALLEAETPAAAPAEVEARPGLLTARPAPPKAAPPKSAFVNPAPPKRGSDGGQTEREAHRDDGSGRAEVLAPIVETAPTTRLLLSSKPTAVVWYRGERLCKTPCDVRVEANADGDRARLEFYRRGYVTQTMIVPLTAGTVQRTMRLEAAPSP